VGKRRVGGAGMGKVIVIDRNPQIRKFIQNHLSELGFEVECFSHLDDSFSVLKTEYEKIGLILFEVSDVYYDNLDYFKEFPETDWHIPVIAMSSSNKKQVVIQTIQAGADDFILKPFNEEYFDEKVLLKLDKKTEKKEKVKTGISINFNKYVQGELIKASKGKYPVGFLMIQLNHIKKEYIDEWSYYKIAQPVFKKLMDEFWDTDLGVQYGAHSLIGIFPFCDSEGILILEKKLKSAYKDYIKGNENMHGYNIDFTSVIYPQNGKNRSEILQNLIEKSIR
jgi:CheY-like chemotaxis protein